MKNSASIFAAALSAHNPSGVASAADAYPNKPVRVVVPFAPGGINDVLARILSQKLGAELGTTIVIDNRGGAGGTLGSGIVAHSAPDGYTLLFSSSSTIVVSPSMYSNLAYDPIKDFSPIAQIASVGSVLVLHPSIAATTVKELIAYAKANPGKLNYGSAGAGASQHLASELFKTMAGINMVHVPYKGGAPAITDLMGGQIQVYFSPLPESISVIKGGKVRALAVTTAKRTASLPDVPTIGESVPGFQINTWQGIGAPKNTSAEIVAMLNKEINAALADEKIKARLAQIGSEPNPMSPAEFEKLVVNETAKWAKVIHEAKIPLQ